MRIQDIVLIVLEVCAGVVMLVDAFMSFSNTFESVMVSFFRVLFAGLMLYFIMYIPDTLREWFPFYFSILGRGLFITFLGALCFNANNSAIGLVSGILGVMVGLIYYLLWIIQSCNFMSLDIRLPPTVMRAKENFRKDTMPETTSNNTNTQKVY